MGKVRGVSHAFICRVGDWASARFKGPSHGLFGGITRRRAPTNKFGNIRTCERVSPVQPCSVCFHQKPAVHLRTKCSLATNCAKVSYSRIMDWEFVELAELHPHKAFEALQHEPEQQKLLVVPAYGFQVTKNN